MATDDDQTTDKHDESDSAQFGDDPHNLNNTPFVEASCVDCGAYVVKARTYTGPTRCTQCGRNHAGITPYTPPPPPPPHTPTPPPPTPEWFFACLHCGSHQPARNAPDATHKMRTHTCPETST
jgi:hypothetical protein